jgi:hypothetical protein
MLTTLQTLIQYCRDHHSFKLRWGTKATNNFYEFSNLVAQKFDNDGEWFLTLSSNQLMFFNSAIGRFLYLSNVQDCENTPITL